MIVVCAIDQTGILIPACKRIALWEGQGEKGENVFRNMIIIIIFSLFRTKFLFISNLWEHVSLFNYLTVLNFNPPLKFPDKD
jgi:hypothetical protein